MNYFNLLEIKQEYDIDQNELKQQYLRKQQQYHPDKTNKAQDDIATEKLNIEKAMLLNEAYKTLSDDYKRAEYLLKIHNIQFDDQSIKDILSPYELEDIFNEYEMLDEISAMSDLQQYVEQKILEQKALIHELNKIFAANNFSKALDITVKLKYLTNLVRNIKLKIQNADNTN